MCQTLVSTKPKVVTAKVPKEVCDHSASSGKKQPPAQLRPSHQPPGPAPAQQTTAESGTMVRHVSGPDVDMRHVSGPDVDMRHVSGPDLEMEDISINTKHVPGPSSNLEDLYTAEYQIDRGYSRGQRGRPDSQRGRPDPKRGHSGPQRGYDSDYKTAYAGGYPGHQPQLRSGGHEEEAEEAEALMLDNDLADSERPYHYL